MCLKADPDAQYPAEIRKLRKRAQKTDALAAARPAVPSVTDFPLGEEFLDKCVASAKMAAKLSSPVMVALDFPDMRFRSISRTCRVPLLSGDWATVVAGREAASAVVTELNIRGYAGSCYRFERQGLDWCLVIKFGY